MSPLKKLEFFPLDGDTPFLMSDDFAPSISLLFKLTHNVTVGQNSDLWPKPAGVHLSDWQSPFACGASSWGDLEVFIEMHP